jgi:hypothetical protein
MQMMSLERWLTIASTASAVLPVARSPTINSRWPRPSANSASIEGPRLHRLDNEVAVDDCGRGAFDRFEAFGGDGRAAIEWPAERIDDPAEVLVRPACGQPRWCRSPWPRFHAVGIVEQHAAKSFAVDCLDEARLATVEVQQFVEPGVRQAGNHSDAVTDRVDAAYLAQFGARTVAATLWRARSSQLSGVSGIVSVFREVGEHIVQIGAPAVAEVDVRAAQFAAADQIRFLLEREVEWQRKGFAKASRQRARSLSWSGVGVTRVSAMPSKLLARSTSSMAASWSVNFWNIASWITADGKCWTSFAAKSPASVAA